MSFFLGLLAGGLLGAYWTRPGGWLGGIHGYYGFPSPVWYPAWHRGYYYPYYYEPHAYCTAQPIYYPAFNSGGYWRYW